MSIYSVTPFRLTDDKLDALARRASSNAPNGDPFLVALGPTAETVADSASACSIDEAARRLFDGQLPWQPCARGSAAYDAQLTDWCRRALPDDWHGTGVYECLLRGATLGQGGVTLRGVLPLDDRVVNLDDVVRMLARFTCPATRLLDDETDAWNALVVSRFDLAQLYGDNEAPGRDRGKVGLVLVRPHKAVFDRVIGPPRFSRSVYDN